ncbi:hypothetical protein DERF_010384 [Dermatophagoides farinae]|uniref:Uncharacterized protein n=1 Tax=Dermatophagoides farinae TaxID=6954 RepID=A0A922I167_DERFA|nr:hypothetical protein DERF_010384 [Dermatophagoides farinae]
MDHLKHLGGNTGRSTKRYLHLAIDAMTRYLYFKNSNLPRFCKISGNSTKIWKAQVGCSRSLRGNGFN